MAPVKKSLETTRIVGAALALALGQSGEPPEWVRLIPPGTFQTNDGRGPFHNMAPDKAIANTLAWLGGREAPAYYDHLSEYVEKTGQPAIAAGWIKDWRVAQDGAIEAKVDWTKLADQRIRDKEYRYLSPVFATDKKTAQVVQLFGFALTNQPAINDLPALAAAQEHNPPKETDVSKLIAQALGLPETATEAELVAAATNLRQNQERVVTAAGLKAFENADTVIAALRDKPDAAKWIAASEHARVTGELSTLTAAHAELKKKLAGDDAEAVFAAALKAGQVTPGAKDYWITTCAAAGSADPLKEFLKVAPKGSAVPLDESGARRAAGDTATVVTAAQLNAQELEHCTKFGLKPESYARELTKTLAAGGIRPLAA
jgi:phage I-like protein